MTMKKRLNELVESLDSTILSTQSGEILQLEKGFSEILSRLKKLQNNRKNLIIIGNGGSAGIASHSANDFINMCNLKAITFHDISVITCLTNDYGYKNTYAKLISCFSSEDDLLIAISSSGNSENILNSVKCFKEKNPNSFVITLSGFENTNKLRAMGDLNFFNNSKSYGIVEISHQFILHFLADKLCNNC